MGLKLAIGFDDYDARILRQIKGRRSDELKIFWLHQRLAAVHHNNFFLKPALKKRKVNVWPPHPSCPARAAGCFEMMAVSTAGQRNAYNAIADAIETSSDNT
jgi:hypothetical protein